MDVTGNIDTRNPIDTHQEVKRIYKNLFSSTLFDNVEYTLEAITELFDGKYPGYQGCDTEYHDLEHTLQAYLAMARIFDGLIREDHAVSREESMVLGLISALGHDTGYIKETADSEGTGAKYTLVHVERSIEFMNRYLRKLGLSTSQIQYVKNTISCTGLGIHLAKIHFTIDREKETGFILGTADFLGQMSDPDYLAKLPKLYDEFREGGINDYHSAEHLIEQTPRFFEDFVMKRLTDDFQSVYRSVATHFGGKNLYIEGIRNNISLIKKIISSQ